MIKRLIHRGLRAVGYDLVRASDVGPVHKPFYLLGFLIAELVSQAGTEDVTFVQVGAADGALGDPLRPSILRYHLRGVLIEPVPWSFRLLQQNYAGESQVRFANCAIAAHAGNRTMYGFAATADTGVHRVSSLDPKNPASRSASAPRETFTVAARTLSEVLAEHDLMDPSILVVDVEGMDAEVVAAALAHGYRPSIIMYESVYLPGATQKECLMKLRDSGYSFVEADVDTYAVRDDFCAASGTIYT